MKIVFSPLLFHKKVQQISKKDTDLEIHKGDQVELIPTAGFKNLIHITRFDAYIFVQLELTVTRKNSVEYTQKIHCSLK